MERIKVDIVPKGITPVCHASQYDKGRVIRFDLMDGLQAYVLSGTETIEFDVCKPDGNIVTVAVTNTSSSYVDVITTQQMTACEGKNACTLKITQGDVEISTINIEMRVEVDPLKDGIESDTEIHNLTEQVISIVSEQYDSDNVIFDYEPTEGHTAPYTVSSTGIKAAIDAVAATIPDELNDLSDVTITTPSNGEIMVYNNGTWENQANPASTTNFAPDYDDTATYNTNDKVIYQGLLYVCLNDNITGAWDGTKWQQISVADYTAELLPISSSDPTNTKDYIDTDRHELLWTNTTHTSDFSAQTITPDTKGYSHFIIYTKAFKNNTFLHGNYCIMGETNQINNIGGTNGGYSGDLEIASRTVAIATNSFTFTQSATSTNGGATSLDNTHCIPYKIFGIK